MKLCIVTIVSGNYLAYAKVLASSVKIHMPEADFRVLIVDRISEDIKFAVQESGLHVIYAESLGLADFERIAYKYDIMELNTALKPTFLKCLFADGFSHVIYLDPDIQLFAPLDPVIESMQNASIVLTPHTMRPVLDGMRPSDVDFLRCGTYNLGFIGLSYSYQTTKMLDWWEDRCLGLGFNDLLFGTFVDQKWIDLVPCYFESVLILKHPGCNVAYWNLHEREIVRNGNGYKVNDQNLVFFHFSGVSADKPEKLSKHQDRHSLDDGSPIADLVAKYCQCLFDEGHASLSMIPYSFGRLNDGTPITSVMRRAICCLHENELTPFLSNSRLQCLLEYYHIKPHVKDNAIKEKIATHILKYSNNRIRLINYLIKVIARLLGLPKLFQLLSYASLLIREENLPAVLMNVPFKLKHLPRR